MAIVTRGSSVKKNLKFFIYGKAGTWKSSLAMQLAALKREDGKDVKLVYIDTEYGSIDNYLEEFCEEYGLNPDNILIVKANTYDEIESALNTAINDEPFYIEDEDGNEEEVLDSDGNVFIADAIALDSATVIQDTTKYAMIKTSEKRARLKAKKKDGNTATDVFVAEQTAGMEFKDYDKLNHKGKNLLRSLVTRTNKMVVVTSRQKDKKERVKNSKGDFDTITVGVMPDCFKDAEYEFFTVLHMYEDEKSGDIFAKVDRKDRTGQFERNSILENPSLFPWQEVINKNVGKKDMKVEKKSYDQIVEEQAEQLERNKKKPSTENKSEAQVEGDVEVKQESKEDIYEKIKNVRNSLKPASKSGLMAEFTKNNLPKPSKNLNLQKLKEILEVAEKYAESCE